MVVQVCDSLKMTFEQVIWEMPCKDVFLIMDYWPEIEVDKTDSEEKESDEYSTAELRGIPGIAYAKSE